MARSTDKGYFTQPMKVGAPLPEDLAALPLPPTLAEIHAEMDRCEVELMFAIAQHRKAWSRMRKHAERRAELVDQPGGLAAIDSDPVWKKRTGDVSWWRGEVEARSDAMVALGAMAAAPHRQTNARDSAKPE